MMRDSEISFHIYYNYNLYFYILHSFVIFQEKQVPTIIQSNQKHLQYQTLVTNSIAQLIQPTRGQEKGPRPRS